MTLREIKKQLVVGLPAIIFLFLWEAIALHNPRTAFLLGQPTAVGTILLKRFGDGSLFADITATTIPLFFGFVLGNFCGIILGLILWRFPTLSDLTRPYLIALGAVPAFIFAPLLIVWFGTGITMKIILISLSTGLVAAAQALTGASNVSVDFFRFFNTLQASSFAIFRHLILPSAASWFFAALRLNVGFGLLAVFVAEFISSERGIAHRALVDAGLYNVSAVCASALVLAMMAILFYSFIARQEKRWLPWNHVEETEDNGEVYVPMNK
jgi:NitT/TauT family transport system permease protein